MVGVGEGLAGVLAIKDPLKPEARGVVAALHQAGMACHLVTGDNWRTARSIAEQLGIINVTAECLPAGKAEKIKVNFHSLAVYGLQDDLKVALEYSAVGSEASLTCHAGNA